MTEWRFICPRCGVRLEQVDAEGWHCPQDDRRYSCVDGIWRFLLPEREAELAPFIRDYETIRAAEGRGTDDSDWYRALPFEDRSRRFDHDWRIRAKSYEKLLQTVIKDDSSLRVVDLGAGNGWLSNRLAARGHTVAAVDILVNPQDGLGAYRHYETTFTPIQADFDHLPLEDDAADVVIFNGTLHYSVDYGHTLAEARRVGKRVVVMDSPFYHAAHSGRQMVREREDHFEQTYGFRSDALPAEHFLTYDRLEQLAAQVGLRWRMHTPFYGLRWMLRPYRAKLRGHREPARFHVLVGERV